MEGLDLDITNYNLDEILKLFHLGIDFTYSDLKSSMKTLYKVHPDKSGLDPKYFIFFKEAYTILLGLYKHRNITNKDTYREEFYSETSAIKLEKFIKDDAFNKNFNKLFEETFKRETCGYDDWLKTSKIETSKEDKNTYFKKKHSIVVKNNNTIVDINNNTDDNYINTGTIEDYSSNTFNKLQYDDVKKVYSETYIPVNENDERINKYNSVEQLRIFRHNDKPDEYTKDESEQMLNESKFSENKQINNKVYELIKEDKKNQELNKKWWNSFNKLCY